VTSGSSLPARWRRKAAIEATFIAGARWLCLPALSPPTASPPPSTAHAINYGQTKLSPICAICHGGVRLQPPERAHLQGRTGGVSRRQPLRAALSGQRYGLVGTRIGCRHGGRRGRRISASLEFHWSSLRQTARC
jgi:hypothetical protein